jgi:hypothetical protein
MYSLNRPGDTGPVFWRIVLMGNPYRLFFSTSFLFVFLALFWQPKPTQSDELARTGYMVQQEAAPTAVGPLFPTPTSPPPTIEAPPPPPTLTPTSLPQPTDTPPPTQEPLPTSTPEPDIDEALVEFLFQVVNGHPGLLTGVYVENVLALPVVQQPERNYMYVSEELGVITQFQSATRRGVTGLLAHNYLSGDLFFGLEIGQTVTLIYGDGVVREYLVTDIQSYEKLIKGSITSDYVNIETGERLSTQELFAQMYTGEDKVTFQTCIKKGSDWSWGRIFVTARPIG